MYAAWTSEAVLIYRRGGKQLETERIEHRTPASVRYFVRLVRRSGALLLRSADGDTTRINIANGEGAFYPIPGWPDELASLPIYRVFPLADGGFAGLSGENSIVLWRPGQMVVVHALPPGFHARAVDQDQSGRLYVAGSTLATTLRSTKRSYAFATSTDHGHSWYVDEKAHGRITTTLYGHLSGAEIEYRTINAIGQHLVLSAEMGDLGEESTLLFVRNSRGHWTSDLIRHDVFRAALALGDGGIESFFHRAQTVVIDAAGRRCSKNLLGRIEKMMAGSSFLPSIGARYMIIDVAPVDAGVAVLVSIRAQDFVRLGEAILCFGDKTDSILFIQRAPAPEMITLC
ncbi:MAG: hypothetical protein U0359_36015 [Byssovorax sp.]